MTSADVLVDAFGRIREVVHQVVDGLTAKQLACQGAALCTPTSRLPRPGGVTGAAGALARPANLGFHDSSGFTPRSGYRSAPASVWRRCCR
jgi:hypothetical protein